MSEVNQDIIVMTDISKSFPGVKALEEVSFNLKRGEIHALVGENGAGKSTLIKVMTGVERQDRGTVQLNGEYVTIRSPLHAQMMGISPVYQEVNLCDYLTVAENIMLGREPHTLFGIDWKKMNEQAEELLLGLGVDIDVSQPLGSYSTAIQQMSTISSSSMTGNGSG